MKFKSRRDLLFTVLGVGLTVFLIACLIMAILEIPEDVEASQRLGIYFPIVLIALVLVLIASMFFFTRYELSKGYLKYQSGVIIGKIKISRIREIIVGKTMRVGMKPATASKGLIIKYDKYEEIYISPESNERFVQEILTLNADIKIIVSN